MIAVVAMPYLLACSAGVYLAAATMLLLKRWQPPQRVPVLLWLITLAAFVLNRAVEPLSRGTAALLFIAVTLIVLQLLRKVERRIDAPLWAALVLIPFLVMLAIAIAPMLSFGKLGPADSGTLRTIVFALLALPSIVALLSALACLRITLRSPQR
ncbi:MAG: hypothetical protein M3Y21_11410 [Candidatus Eremiobacteraeota bacterium]|nr:hypothetical protein [Candidatus Eremiobacteraeota bacterium]